MIKGYLTIMLRNILRHKLVSFITITGLSIGLAGSMFIFLWVMDELNFDRFNKNGDAYTESRKIKSIRMAFIMSVSHHGLPGRFGRKIFLRLKTVAGYRVSIC